MPTTHYDRVKALPAAWRWWLKPHLNRYSFISSQSIGWLSSLGFMAAGWIRFKLQRSGWKYWSSSIYSLFLVFGTLAIHRTIEVGYIYFIKPVPRPPSRLPESSETIQLLDNTSSASTDSDQESRCQERCQYQYRPLTSNVYTRLLLLYPAWSAKAELKGELVDFPYDTPIYLHALSYVWGSDKRTHHILLEGKKLFITSNCAAALIRLRPRCTGILLWVDSICIDQSNQEEKSEQVQNMQNIYRKAADTIICLDDESGVDEIVLRYLRMFAAGKYFRNERMKKWWEMKIRCKISDRGHDYMFANLVRNSWMSRIWTVQELALGVFDHTWIVCGSQKVQFDHVIHSLTDLAMFAALADTYRLDGMLDSTTIMRRSLSRIDLGDVVDNAPAPMSKLLEQLQTQRASDPRDKIYGLFAFFDATDVMLPDPSYAKSAPQVYWEAMVTICQHEKNVNLLSLCSGHREADMNIVPSWVPDFRTPGTCRRMFIGNQKATSNSKAVLNFMFDNATLMVHAEVIEMVEYVSDKTLWCPAGDPTTIYDSVYTNLDQGARQSLDTLLDWMHAAFEYPDSPYESQSEAFRDLLLQSKSMPQPPTEHFENWLTLLAGIRPLETQCDDTDINSPGYTHAQLAQLLATHTSEHPALSKYYDSTSPLHDLTQDVYWTMMAMFKTSRLLAEIYHYVWTLNRDTRFFITYDGHIGTGALNVRKGDFVALIAGFKQPMILREAGVGFEVVGTAYIEGLMDGVYWESLESHPDNPKSRIVLV